MNNLKKYISLIVLAIFYSQILQAQNPPPAKEKEGGIWMPAIIINGDTLPVDNMPVVYFEEIVSDERQHYLNRLRYNIQKVYPYAVLASNVMKKMDYDLGANPSKKDRRKYVNNLDIELNAKFKDELKNLTTTQGKILVKLINRQTGRKAYDLIKELKGGANARMYQTAFSFIDNDLKTQYDPFGADKDIELIVGEIEASGYYQQQKIGTKSPAKK